ncbi:Macrophage killing protein with similarity to conjugation protein [Burkholderia pseudomallei]|nr:Macrophage killing protein with similarity to conjugation protein [Burkholderia pseudomallei]
MDEPNPRYVLDLKMLAFYEKWFPVLIYTILAAVVAVAVLTAGFIVVKSQKVEREYFGTDGKGHLIPMVPLGEPYLDDGALLTWAQKCVTQANNFDFVHYREQLQASSVCFSDDGWQSFQVALAKSGNLDMVKSKNLISSGVVTRAPVVTKNGRRNGQYLWQVQMPLLVTYQGGQNGQAQLTQRLLVTLTIGRVPTYINENGVGIEQYISEERNQ